MRWYKCKKCGYAGDRLIYSFTDYGYIVASNDDDPEIIGPPPPWVTVADCEIGVPIGCPECRNWGTSGFEFTEEASAMLDEAEISMARMVDEEFDVAEPQVLQIAQIKKNSTPSDFVCHPSRGELGHTEKEEQMREEDGDDQDTV